jgi:hypothetical protein
MSVAAETITATRARTASSSRASTARGEEDGEEGSSRATAARGGSRSQRRVDPPRARRGAQRATREDGDARDDAETIARARRDHRDDLGDAAKDPDAATAASPTRAAPIPTDAEED